MAKVASKNAKVKDLKAAAEAKNWTKVIKAVRSPKSGAYTFKEQIIHKDKVNEFISAKQSFVVNNLKASFITVGGFFVLNHKYLYNGFFR